ncbi:L-threonine ammonia-lyase-like isoform X2 [Oratosquilla oratoria]|uniref:L-threonine ammonia-lyase-like isoform X2 n=1 Tax=Oratosquilla oratoria TaxID=337810 RepID=UPI003F762FA8
MLIDLNKESLKVGLKQLPKEALMSKMEESKKRMAAFQQVSKEALAAMTEEAKKRTSGHLKETPLQYSPVISADTGVYVYLKLESEQVGGSFKARGAFNKASVLASKGIRRVITASTGNHGIACTLAMNSYGIECRVVIPTTADPEKKRKLEENGGHLLQLGAEGGESETHARSLADLENIFYVSPYNDYDIMAGQGTVALEILKQLPSVDAIFASVGGGGLIGGIAAYIKTKKPQCKVYGCSPEMSKVMHESVKAGVIVNEESYETLSDGTAGSVEEDAVTLPVCKDFVDEWVLVTEEEIAYEIFYCLKNHNKTVEGAAGVALAAVRKCRAQLKGQRVVAVMCGANISPRTLKGIVEKFS